MAMKSWESAKNNEPEERWEDLLRWGDLGPRYKRLRPVGGFWPVAYHWFEIYSHRQEKKVTFPLVCPRFNPETESYDLDKDCPACDNNHKTSKVNLANFIDRDLQEKGDANPIVVLRLNYTQMQEIVNIVDLIKRDPADVKKGVDLAMSYDRSKTGRSRYSVQRGDDTPLTAEEKKYDLYQLDEIVKPATVQRLSEAMNRMINNEEDDSSWKQVNDNEEDIPVRARKISRPPSPDISGDDDLEAEEDGPFGLGPQAKAGGPISRDSSKLGPNGLPLCFGEYNGSPECIKCSVRSDCISKQAEDDDDDW